MTEKPIWEARLDDRYQCTVTRVDTDTGVLRVHDEEADLLLLQEPVGLLYGARFGPDVADVWDWEQKCVALVDEL